jgi:drug/metabolite transporter (DMT)-like permease
MPAMRAGFTRAHAAILATALLFSTGGAAIKACGLTAWQVAGFRSGVAALAMVLLVPAARQVSGRVLLVAVAYAATLISFVLANKLTSAAQAVFLQAAAPLYVVGLERCCSGHGWRGATCRSWPSSPPASCCCSSAPASASPRRRIRPAAT